MKNRHIFTAIAVLLAVVLVVSARELLRAQSDEDAKTTNAKTQPGDASGAKKTAAGAKKTDPGNTSALQTLRKAAKALEGNKTVQATIEEHVSIADRAMYAVGTYQRGENLKLRYEMTVRLDSEKARPVGSLLQVSDGSILWTRYLIDGKPRLTRRDVKEILKVAARSGNSPKNELIARLGLGGLPALLGSLEQSMTFDQVKIVDIDGQPVTLIEGGWNASFRQAFKTQAGGRDELPAHVPDRVRVYFDKQLLPRRIQYLKTRRKPDRTEALLTLDIKGIKLNAPIDDKVFDYVPPDGVFVDDVTSGFTELFKQAAPR